MMRWQAAAASGLCVIIMIVWLNRSLSSRNMFRTISEFSESRLPVGSSAKTRAGGFTTARGLATAIRIISAVTMHAFGEPQVPFRGQRGKQVEALKDKSDLSPPNVSSFRV